MKIAIVTGASSGLGREFVRQIAAKYRPDEIWGIARRHERLLELQEELPSLVPLPLDLCQSESFTHIEHKLEKEQPEIVLLVNAAGVARFGYYSDLTSSEADEMVDLNCRAAVKLTNLILPYMKRGAGIIQVASASAFQPLPGLNIYAATKAFLLSYSRALRWELRGRGIKVTAVCPDWVKTEFIATAQQVRNPDTVKNFFFAVKPDGVVRQSLFDNRLNLPVSTYSVAFLHRFFAKFIPHELIILFWEIGRRI